MILGPQGSGKGTQARLLGEKLGLGIVEAGALLREIAKTNPEVDEQVNKKGQLLPDTETFAFIKKHIEEKYPSLDNIIFDGYPRSVRQYDLLKEYLTTKGAKIDKAVFLDISDAETVRRLSARRTCSACGEVFNIVTNPTARPEVCDNCGGKLVQREDDKPGLIEKRLRLFRTSTEPLIRKFEDEGILINVNGEQPIETILGQIIEKLNDV